MGKLRVMRNLIIGCVMGLGLITSSAQGLESDTLPVPLKPKAINNAFTVGEHLKYRIHYGIIDAGEAELRVHSIENKQGRSAYKVSGIGRSVGMFKWFMDVRDYYETYIDSNEIIPLEFIRDVKEGSYTNKEHSIFDPINNTVHPKKNPKDTMRLNVGVQDLLSAFYYARCLDFSNLTYGDEFPVEVYLDKETFPMNLKYVGEETLKTSKGKFNCLIFKPMVQEGRVFREEEGMTIWVSNDKNRVPIRVETELFVGSLRMDIESYQGLKHPLTNNRK
ncbi:MAG: hypothetical protein ACI8ZO_000298 [Flavobacteriales bacterium]|jgi:hypothetical protein